MPLKKCVESASDEVRLESPLWPLILPSADISVRSIVILQIV